MVPRDLIESDLDNGCIRLYAYLDGVQGEKGWPAKGYAATAQRLGMQARTVGEKAEILEARGLIEITRDVSSGTSGARKEVMRVIHNPARKRTNPAVVLGEPRKRYRSKSKYSANAEGERLDRRSERKPRSTHPDQRVQRDLEAEPRTAFNAPRSRSTRCEEGLLPEECEMCGQEAGRWADLLDGTVGLYCDYHADEKADQGYIVHALDDGPPEPASTDPF
jgi:hypothetical protein